MNLRIAATSLMLSLTVVGPATAFAATSTGNGSTAVYATVQPGDTMWKLSSEHNVSVAHLEQWNHLTDTSVLQLGSKLIVGYTSGSASPARTTSVQSGSSAVYTTIQTGDTLWSLASQHGVTVAQLERWNNLSDSSTLQLGHKLIVGYTSGSASSARTTSLQSGSSAVYTTIQSGDTLWSLASQHGVTVAQLERWNNLSDSSTLQLGHKLIVGYTSNGNASSVSNDGSYRISSRSESSTLNSGTFGMQVVQYAQQFIGTPYQWGGESTSGFDCSGLVQFCYGHFGIALARSSYDQYQEGTPVSQSNLVPGDLVFFDSDGAGASHVGLYVGGNQFINAADSGVRIDSFNESYWGARYVGARRVHS